MSNEEREDLRVVRVVLKKENGSFLLLQRRKQEGKYDAGRWEFAGGKLEVGELDYEKAGKREVLEETGIGVGDIERLSDVCSPTVFRGEQIVWREKVFVARVNDGTRVSLSEEHARYAWVDRAMALKMDLTFGARRAIGGLVE